MSVDSAMFDILSGAPDVFAGTEPQPSVYGSDPLVAEDRAWSLPKDLSTASGGGVEEKLELAYTYMGEQGFDDARANKKSHWVVFLHGVPTNRRQWFPVQKRIARFWPTLSVDLLGMGTSSIPSDKFDKWAWRDDADRMHALFEELGINGRVVYVADDWGGGPLAHHTSAYPNDLVAWVSQDPIAFDGYPVNEIQAIGRSAGLPYDPTNPMSPFHQAMGAFDQTLVQIYKTMVHRPDEVYNQYSLRNITFPYVDVDYERKATGVSLELTRKSANGADDVPTLANLSGATGPASSVTLGLRMDAIRVLAKRAQWLSSAQLLPHHPEKNPFGPKYSNCSKPGLVMWGEFDNMMPTNQLFRFPMVYSNAEVELQKIPRAGHFAACDQPDEVAERIVNFLYRIERAYTDPTFVQANGQPRKPFFGYTGIWKGDEKAISAMQQTSK